MDIIDSLLVVFAILVFTWVLGFSGLLGIPVSAVYIILAASFVVLFVWSILKYYYYHKKAVEDHNKLMANHGRTI